MIEDHELNRAIRAYRQGDGSTLHKLQRVILAALHELKERREHEKVKNASATRKHQ